MKYEDFIETLKKCLYQGHQTIDSVILIQNPAGKDLNDMFICCQECLKQFELPENMKVLNFKDFGEKIKQSNEMSTQFYLKKTKQCLQNLYDFKIQCYSLITELQNAVQQVEVIGVQLQQIQDSKPEINELWQILQNMNNIQSISELQTVQNLKSNLQILTNFNQLQGEEGNKKIRLRLNSDALTSSLSWWDKMSSEFRQDKQQIKSCINTLQQSVLKIPISEIDYFLDTQIDKFDPQDVFKTGNHRFQHMHKSQYKQSCVLLPVNLLKKQEFQFTISIEQKSQGFQQGIGIIEQQQIIDNNYDILNTSAHMIFFGKDGELYEKKSSQDPLEKSQYGEIAYVEQIICKLDMNKKQIGFSDFKNSQITKNLNLKPKVVYCPFVINGYLGDIKILNRIQDPLAIGLQKIL